LEQKKSWAKPKKCGAVLVLPQLSDYSYPYGAEGHPSQAIPKAQD